MSIHAACSKKDHDSCQTFSWHQQK